MNTLRLLPLLFLTGLAFAEDSADFRIETYSVPTAAWMKIPSRIRDDHAQLRTTLLAQVPKGTVLLRDSIGGSVSSRRRTQFSAVEEFLHPTEFEEAENSILPIAWETRHVGSEFELEVTFGKETNLAYVLLPRDPPMRSLLRKGPNLDVARTKLPVFSRFRYTVRTPILPVTLIAYAPDRDPAARNPRIVAGFLLANDQPGNEKPIMSPPGQTIELLGLRGSSTVKKDSTPKLLAELLRYGSSYMFSVGATQTPGSRLSITSVKEVFIANDADAGDRGPIPTGLESREIGTLVTAHILPPKGDKVSVALSVDHDLKDPVLPVIPGKGGALIDKLGESYIVQFRIREDVTPGEWVLLGEQPLAKILGAGDRDGKGMSCYLFGRLTIGK